MILAVCEQESTSTHWTNWRIKISPVGAIGFMQIMPWNSKRYNNQEQIPATHNLYHPEDNLKAGAFYYNILLGQAFPAWQVNPDDNVDILAKVFACYNGGNIPTLSANSWKMIVKDDLMPAESIRYAIQIKQKLNLPLKTWQYPGGVTYGEQQWLNDH